MTELDDLSTVLEQGNFKLHLLSSYDGEGFDDEDIIQTKLRVEYNFPSEVLNLDRKGIIRTSSDRNSVADVTILDMNFLDDLSELEHLEHYLKEGKKIRYSYMSKITKPDFEFNTSGTKIVDQEAFELEKFVWDFHGIDANNELYYYSLPIICCLYTTPEKGNLMMELKAYTMYAGEIINTESQEFHLAELQSMGSLSRLIGE